MDATRTSDNVMVLMKRIDRTVHPYELEIAQYFSTGSMSADPRNHCCPTYEVLQDPTNENISILVMPHLRRYINPTFQTVGEAVEFFRQVFEVRLDPVQLVSSHRHLYPGIAIYARAPRCPSVRILAPLLPKHSLIGCLQRLHDAQYHDGCSSYVSRRISS